MKILIADDEKLARQRLIGLIGEIGGGIQVVAEAANGREALEKWKECMADAVLLDVRMPVMDGLQTARALAGLEFPPAVIFATAYDEHALQAFESNAIDYLLKPVRKERLTAALKKAEVFSRAKWEGLQRSLPELERRSHICVHVHGDMHLVPVRDIYYFHADQKYVTLKTQDKEYLIDDPLKRLEEEFAGIFIRIHRNALVSLMHIEELQKDREGQLAIKFHGLDETLAVSRRLQVAVRQCFKEFKLHRIA
ncbi:MAG: LytR/AlgR family response regulator transcription factor [Gammaproteobacteria bacterium]